MLLILKSQVLIREWRDVGKKKHLYFYNKKNLNKWQINELYQTHHKPKLQGNQLSQNLGRDWYLVFSTARNRSWEFDYLGQMPWVAS